MSEATVIGLGPAGARVAAVLARSGVQVTAFQPAHALPSRSEIVSPPPTVRRRPDETAVPASTPPVGADLIGGAKHLAAPQSYRLDDGAYRLPAGHADAPPAWPFSADELAPWHALVEDEMGVAPRPATPWTARMAAAARAWGHEPLAAPAARSRDVSALARHPRIRVIDAPVTAVLRDASGSACGVEYLDHGRARRHDSRTVILAGAVVPTVRLLLLSGITAGGRVGAGLLAHHSFTVHGHFPGQDLGRDAADPAHAVAVTAFESAQLESARPGFRGGSVLQAAMSGPRTAAWAANLTRGLRETDAAAWVGRHAAEIGTVWAQPDQLPHPDNRIDLDPEHTDRLGRPVARLTLGLGEEDHARWRFLSARMADWLTAAGAARTWAGTLAPQPLGAHLYGGAVLGADRTSSVVDPYGAVHDVPGLHVVGSATFPSAGGRGPVQTIEAMAWRTAARLARELGAVRSR